MREAKALSKEHNKGMWLRQTTDPRKKNTHWLICGLVTLLNAMTLAVMAAGVVGFTAANAALIMAVTIAGCGLLYTILLKNNRENWLVILMFLSLLAGTILCRQQLLEGFRICWNQAGNTLLRQTGWVLPSFQLAGLDVELCVSLFSITVSVAIFLLCGILMRLAPKVLACLLVLFAIVSMALLKFDRDFVWLLPMLLMAVVTFLYGIWQKKATLSVMSLSGGICAVVAIALLALCAMPGVSNRAEQSGLKVQKMLHAKQYETKYQTLPEGDFTHFAVVEREAEPALVVTMDVPHAMYLRGYTAATLEGDRWLTLDRNVIADDQTLLYWLNTKSFDLNAQFGAIAALAQLPQSTVTIQNIGACSYYRYAPFSIVAGEWMQPENLNADGIYADGQRDYTYSAWVGTGENILQVLTMLQTSEDPAVLEYRKAESAYRQFVYEQYLQIPDEVKTLLQEAWDGAASQFDQPMTRQQCQESALIFLAKCFPEEGTPENLQLPLSVAEGTVYQYVTVAVMTLRYFGIPARYVEGYAVTEEMVSGLASGDSLTVDSSCATAWVEVYQDGIGWTPMDLAPGMGQRQEPSDEEEPNEDPNSPNEDKTEEPEEQEPEKQEQPEPEPIGGTLVRIFRNLLKIIALIILGICLLIWLLFVRRKWILKRKNRKFDSEDCKNAVAWIYADAALLLEKMGFQSVNGSMRALQPKLEVQFGLEFAEQFAAATDLNDRAVFCSRPMDGEQRRTAMEFHNCVAQKLHVNSKWYRRLWLKWLLCLY